MFSWQLINFCNQFIRGFRGVFKQNLEMLFFFLKGCPRGVMVKAMDYGIEVREFILQSLYYVHFQVNTLGKGMNPLILPAMG